MRRRTINILKQFSTITLETLKDLGSKGQQLTADSLYNELRSKKKIKALIDDLENVKAVGKKSVSPEKQKIDELEKKLFKVKQQKDKLFRQLTDLEMTSDDFIAVYNRMLLSLTDMLKNDGNKSIHGTLNDFRKTVKKGAGAQILNVAFGKLKNAVFNLHVPEDDTEDEKPKLKSKSKSKFSLKKFISSDSSGSGEKELNVKYLKLFKETYQDIVNELCLDLGEDYIKRLVQLSKKIHSADSTDEFDALRREILSILQDYIKNVSSEREKAAKLISDVVMQLTDVEQYFVESREFVSETNVANEEFGKNLEDHVNSLRENVEFSKTLEELRNAVVDKLQAITDAIKDKSLEDKKREKHAEATVEGLQVNMNKLRTEVEKAHKKAKLLEEELLKDPLTGAYNRRAYEKNMENELQRYIRYKRPFSALLFDVDHFKQINDNYGHAIGDKCLKEIIIRAGRVLRDNDILARFGGEEFIALLPETEMDGARGVAEKLRKSVENIEFVHKEDIIKITVSIGVTQVNDEDFDVRKLFDRMDMAMYEAKNSGRNKVVEK